MSCDVYHPSWLLGYLYISIFLFFQRYNIYKICNEEKEKIHTVKQDIFKEFIQSIQGLTTRGYVLQSTSLTLPNWTSFLSWANN